MLNVIVMAHIPGPYKVAGGRNIVHNGGWQPFCIATLHGCTLMSLDYLTKNASVSDAYLLGWYSNYNRNKNIILYRHNPDFLSQQIQYDSICLWYVDSINTSDNSFNSFNEVSPLLWEQYLGDGYRIIIPVLYIVT